MIYTPATFSDEAHAFIMGQIGGQNSVVTATREYTTNMIDAYYEKGEFENIRPRIIIDKKNRTITFKDLGVGMNLEHLNYLRDNVGNSLKKRQSITRGEKGFGILSYIAFGKGEASMIIYTRDKSTSEDGYNISEWLGDFKVRNQTISSLEESIIPRGKTGTVVVIKDCKNEVFDSIKPLRIINELSETYHPILQSGVLDLKIDFIGYKRKKDIVPPLSFVGDLVVAEDFKQHYFDEETGESKTGDGEICIWYDSENSKGRIRVYNKGVLVHRNISQLEGFEFPWNSPKLDGFILENFLTLSMARDRYESTTAYFEFSEGLKDSYEGDLEIKVQEEKNRADKNKALAIGRDVMKGMQKVYVDLWKQVDEYGPNLFVLDKNGEERYVSPTNERGTGGGGRTGGKKGSRVRKIKDPSDKSSDKRSFKENIEGEKRRVKPAMPKLPKYDFKLTSFSRSAMGLRSRLDTDLNMVYVNDIHSSYNDVKDDSLRRDEYYAERVADETAISVRKILVSDFKMDLNDAIEFSDRLREEGLYHNLKAIREKHSITRKKKRK